VLWYEPIVAFCHFCPALTHRGTEYIVDGGLLATSGSDLTLALWDATSNYAPRARIATDYPLTSLMYSSHYRLLCCGTTAGHIHLWRVTDEGLRVVC
jgi:WD40 repeat protein